MKQEAKETQYSSLRLFSSEHDMPHVVINGPASVGKFYQDFETIYIKDEDSIIKVRDVFLNTKKTKALLECVVVEDRFPLTFYMILSQGKGKITVRLDPLTDPEKSDSVKRLLAIVGHKVKSLNPACQYGKHSLAGYLIESK